MLVPVNWLKDFVELTETPQELSELLTSRGLEVEGLRTGPAGDVIEIELTPNRGDCASILGVARELSSRLARELKVSENTYEEAGGAIGDGFTLKVEDPDKCPIYHLKLIRGIKIGESPKWLKDRLISAGQRPVNNIVDATNYVMLETGQPLHAFDAGRTGRDAISVGSGIEGDEIKVLDGTMRRIASGDVVISSGGRAVALGGIIGGEESSVNPATTEVLLESAFFKSQVISATERRLGLKTEASYRFSRIVDPGGVKRALDRACGLISEIAGGIPAPGTLSFDSIGEKKRTVTVNIGHINRLLGTSIDESRVKELLESLRFTVEGTGDLTVTVPSFRNDVERPVDVIEEVARAYGYENITPALPESGIITELLREQDIFARGEEALRALGYAQCVTLTLTNSEACANAGFDPAELVCIDNPVSRNMDALRPSLIPGLIETAKYNINQSRKNIKFYERGPVFSFREGKYRETENLAYILRSEDFFDSKRAAVSVLDALRQNYEFKYESCGSIFENGKSARILINGRDAGSFGCISSGARKLFDIEGNALAGGYISLDALDTGVISVLKYEPWSAYPAVMRDISIVVPVSLTHSSIYDSIANVGGVHLKAIRLYDVFVDKKLGEGKKSLTYELEFNSAERTLTSEEVEIQIEKIIKELERVFSAALREI